MGTGWRGRGQGECEKTTEGIKANGGDGSTLQYFLEEPKLWNKWKKCSDLTNNQNEGYNSRINKILSSNHPNPWVLVCMLTKELIRAETEALWIKVC